MRDALTPGRWTALGRVLVTGVMLLTLPAEAGSGVSVGAHAGAGYLLNTLERPGVWNASSNLDLSAGLSVRGGFLRPQLLRWSGNIAYGGVWQVVEKGGAGNQQTVAFGAQVSLLSGSPTPLSLNAQRSYTNLSVTSPRRTTGTAVSTGYGGTALVAFQGYPRLSATLARNETETSNAAGRQSFNGATTLGLTLGQNVKLLEYSASYATAWASGTLENQQYGTHEVRVRVASPITPTLQVIVNDQYFVRLPTNSDPTNPRYEGNALLGMVIWRRSPQVIVNFGYSGLQSSVLAPGTLNTFSSSHALDESVQWRVLPTLAITQTLSAGVASTRSAGDQLSGARGTAGAGFQWQVPASWGGTSLGVTGTGGVAGDNATAPVGTWSVGADGQISWRTRGVSLSAAYSIGYANGGTRLFGHSVRQQLRGDALFLPGAPWRIRAFVVGADSRRNDAAVGYAFARSAQFSADVSFRAHGLQLFGAYRDGLSDSLSNPLFMDVGFLSSAYNSQSADIGASLSTSFDGGRFSLRATARYTETSVLGQGALREAGVSVGVAYTIGKFRFSADDLLVFGEPGGNWYRSNILMLRLSRDFEWSF